MSKQIKDCVTDSKNIFSTQRRKVNKKPGVVSAVIIAVLISIFVVLMAVAAIFGFVYFYEKENPNHSNIGEYVDYSTDEDGNKYYHSKDAAGETVQKPVDGQDLVKNQYNFLIIGKDRAAFNTDVLILASYNITDGSVSMMQIPRDTYVQVPDKRGNIKGRRFNALLAMYYNQAHTSGVSYKEALTIACGNMRDAVSDIFGVPINYYVMMDLEGFVNIVDAIGGVDMYVPRDMKYNDPEQGLYINLKKGYQNLDGNKAEQFIRFRKGYANADLGRVDAQKLFISAFIEKVQKSFSVDTVVAIVNQVSKYVVTDVEADTMIYLAKKALSVDPENIVMMTIPGDLGGKYYVAYRDDTFEAINTYFNPFNVPLSKDKFDADGSLYDNKDSYLYGVYTKTYTGYRESTTYSAGSTEGIYIPTVKVPDDTTEAVDITDITGEVTDTDISVPDSTDDLHTVTDKSTDITDVTLDAETDGTTDESDDVTTDEPAETTGEIVTATEPVETTDMPIETTAEYIGTTDELVNITEDAVSVTEEPTAKETSEPSISGTSDEDIDADAEQ